MALSLFDLMSEDKALALSLLNFGQETIVDDPSLSKLSQKLVNL